MAKQESLPKLKKIIEARMKMLRGELFYGRNFSTLWLEFIIFICESPELAPIIQKLALEHRIAREFMLDMFFIFMASQHEKKLIMPIFYSPEVEESYALMVTFKDTVKNYERNKKLKPEELSRDSWPDAKNRYYHVRKLYHDICEEIELAKIREKTLSGHSLKLSFDPNKSRLHVMGKEIKIRKFSDQYHALNVIFEEEAEIEKEWFFEEISDKIDPARVNEKRYYNAIYQVDKKVAEVGYPDFFIKTRHSAKISPKYLS